MEQLQGQQAQRGSMDGSGRVASSQVQFSSHNTTSPKLESVPGGQFHVDSVSGSGIYSYPLALSAGRGDFGPKLSLSYDSGSGNGIFGLGWSINAPQISRLTNRRVPTYEDDDFLDAFSHSELGQLVPELTTPVDQPADLTGFSQPKVEVGDGTTYSTFLPRTLTKPTRIQLLRSSFDPQDISWRVTNEDNVTATFGTSDASRVFDSETFEKTGHKRIGIWLLDAVYDDRGNAVLYEYKAEDSVGVDMTLASEANRPAASRRNARHLSAIRYGNRTPNRSAGGWTPFHPSRLPPNDWLFEVVFDYGQYSARLSSNTNVLADQQWSMRPDPYSHYRYGFEIRGYRLCRRVLMFHHMPEKLGQLDTLVSATEISYALLGGFSTIWSIHYTGYNRADDAVDYAGSSSLPAVTFRYTGLASADEAVAGSLDYQGFNGPAPRWISLKGDGIMNLVSQDAYSWFTRDDVRTPSSQDSNDTTVESSTSFFEPVLELPNEPGSMFDIDGDGFVDAVPQLAGNLAGYFSQDSEARWNAFKPFSHCLNTLVPNTTVNSLDLTGAGNSDLLFLQGGYIAWSRSLGPSGFTEPRLAHLSTDNDGNEADNPMLLASSESLSVFFADMTGDGLSDLVQIQDSSICYWPNLGYGRFGFRVTMDNAPVLGPEEGGSTERCLLTDADGSGLANLLHFHIDGDIRLYRNRGGNAWSQAVIYSGLPVADSLARISSVDLFGTGSNNIVWMSEGSSDLHYLDLNAGKRPRLLSEIANGVGLVTSIDHTSSTVLYAADKRAGLSWLTNLPYPVWCVTRVRDYDMVTKCISLRSYRYRHGYHDPYDREFRGFASVEEHAWDELAVDPTQNSLQVIKTPATRTKKWYSLGYFNALDDHQSQLYQEFYQDTTVTGSRFGYIPSSSVSELDLVRRSPDDLREAHRAFKGRLLRVETYTKTDNVEGQVPLRIVSFSYASSRRQAGKHGVHPAVFMLHDREVVSTIVEGKRDVGNWRIEHTCFLAHGDFFNPTKVIQFAPGMNDSGLDEPAPERVQKIQRASIMSLVEYDYTNAVADMSSFRAPNVSEQRTFRYTALAADLFSQDFTIDSLNKTFPTVDRFADADFRLDDPFLEASEERKYKVLTNLVRTYYWSNDLQQPLPLGKLESLALASHSLTCALTATQAKTSYGSVNVEAQSGVAPQDINSQLHDCGYVVDEEGTWWVPSEQISHVTDGGDVQEAQQSFFSVKGMRDPFGSKTAFRGDIYGIFTEKITDALDIFSSTKFNYLALAPSSIVDANANISVSTYDACGRPYAVCVFEKDQAGVDTYLKSLKYLNTAQMLDFIADPLSTAQHILGQSTAVTFQCLDGNKAATDASQLAVGMNFSATLMRRQLPNVDNANEGDILISISYLDGRNRVVDTATLAEPGEPGGLVRWHHSAWVVADAAGQAIKMFEPQYHPSHKPLLSPFGYAKTTFRDALGRTIGTLQPDRSWTKVEYLPWKTMIWNAGDLGLSGDPSQDPLLSFQVRSLCEQSEYQGGWDGFPSSQEGFRLKAQAKVYNGTPSVHYLNAVGDSFATEEKDARKLRRLTIDTHDFDGRRRVIVDPRGLIVQLDVLDMAGRVIRRSMADSGITWTLHDAQGRQVLSWKNSGTCFRYAYDRIGRSTAVHWKPRPEEKEICIESFEYGDNQPHAADNNVIGQLYRVLDQSGVQIFERRDMFSHVITSSQCLTEEPGPWSDVRVHRSLSDKQVVMTTFDMHGRVVVTERPSHGRVMYNYNRTGLLNSVTLQQDGSELNTVIEKVGYDAYDRAITVLYGNGVERQSVFDKVSQKLVQRSLTRADNRIETLTYMHDVVGNIITIDKSFSGLIATSESSDSQVFEYDYDAFSQLVRATGREVRSSTLRDGAPSAATFKSDHRVADGSLPIDAMTVIDTFEERYQYDAAGNLINLAHRGLDSPLGWERRFTYESNSNHLSAFETVAGSDTNTTVVSYDAWGNLVKHGDGITCEWDALNQMSASSVKLASSEDETLSENGIRSAYTYDSSYKRTRKRVMRDNIVIEDAQYFSGGHFQLRDWIGSDGKPVQSAVFSIELPGSSQVDMGPCLLVETTTLATGDITRIFRYQIRDHRNSVSYELDAEGELLSSEEFTPYGSSSMRLQTSKSTPTPAAAYGINGKEVDQRTGTDLAYYGRRYYAPWLGRWTSADPIGTGDGPNVYAFVHGNPIMSIDHNGTGTVELAMNIVDLLNVSLRLYELWSTDDNEKEKRRKLMLKGKQKAPKELQDPRGLGTITKNKYVEAIKPHMEVIDAEKALERRQALVAEIKYNPLEGVGVTPSNGGAFGAEHTQEVWKKLGSPKRSDMLLAHDFIPAHAEALSEPKYNNPTARKEQPVWEITTSKPEHVFSVKGTISALKHSVAGLEGRFDILGRSQQMNGIKGVAHGSFNTGMREGLGYAVSGPKVFPRGTPVHKLLALNHLSIRKSS